MNERLSRLASLIHSNLHHSDRPLPQKATALVETLPPANDIEVAGIRLGSVMVPKINMAKLALDELEGVVLSLDPADTSASAAATLEKRVGKAGASFVKRANTAEGRLMRLIWLLGVNGGGAFMDRNEGSVVAAHGGDFVGIEAGVIKGLPGEGLTVDLHWEDAALDVPLQVKVPPTVRHLLGELKKASQEAHTAAMALLHLGEFDEVVGIGLMYLILRPGNRRCINIETVFGGVDSGISPYDILRRSLRGRRMKRSHFDRVLRPPPPSLESPRLMERMEDKLSRLLLI